MKTKIIFFLSLLCMTVFVCGQKQTIFVQKSDGSIDVTKEIKDRDSGVKVIDQDCSNLLGTPKQKLEAINNPGVKVPVSGSHIVFSQTGLSVSVYKDTGYVLSLDGKILKGETISILLFKESGFAAISLYLYLIIAFYLLYRNGITTDEDGDDKALSISVILITVLGFVVSLFLDTYILYTTRSLPDVAWLYGGLLAAPVICMVIFLLVGFYVLAFRIPPIFVVFGISIVIFIFISAFWGILICIFLSILGAILGKRYHVYIDHITLLAWEKVKGLN